MSNILRPASRTYAQIKMGKQNGEAPLVQTANLPKLMSLPTFKNDSLPVIYKRNVEQPRLEYLQKPSKTCNQPLTVFVKTARSSKLHATTNREAIREYVKWMRPNGDVNLYFLLGHDDKGHVLDGDLKMENAKNGDIIVGDFEDTYDNLPIKTFLGYQYFNDYCRKSTHVTFFDDDTFVRLDQFDEIFSDEKGAKDEIICLRGQPIHLEHAPYFGKYYIWHDQWPVVYDIPPYCNGQCMAASAKRSVDLYSTQKSELDFSARAIYRAAAHTDRHDLRIEDMYYVGIMRRKARLNDPLSISELQWSQGTTDYQQYSTPMIFRPSTRDAMPTLSENRIYRAQTSFRELQARKTAAA